MASFFRYPGGKAKLSAEISSRLVSLSYGSEEVNYREPFFGGGSVCPDFLLLSPSTNFTVWLNDKDIGIACLWTAVIKHYDQLRDKIFSYSPRAEDFTEFRDALNQQSSFPESVEHLVDIGFKKLAIHQISYSGLGVMAGGPIGGASQESKYKVGCRWSAVGICKKMHGFRNVILACAGDRIRFTNSDFEIVVDNEEDRALLYLDPPYFHAGPFLYRESFCEEDHLRLSSMLRRTSHKWLLSYDDCSEVRDMYSWAHIEAIDVTYTITSVKSLVDDVRAATRKSELLITNGPTWPISL